MEECIAAYQEPVSVTVRPIENGYLVESYCKGKYETWYCIDTQEITEKLGKFL